MKRLWATLDKLKSQPPERPKQRAEIDAMGLLLSKAPYWEKHGVGWLAGDFVKSQALGGGSALNYTYSNLRRAAMDQGDWQVGHHFFSSANWRDRT